MAGVRHRGSGLLYQALRRGVREDLILSLRTGWRTMGPLEDRAGSVVRRLVRGIRPERRCRSDLRRSSWTSTPTNAPRYLRGVEYPAGKEVISAAQENGAPGSMIHPIILGPLLRAEGPVSHPGLGFVPAVSRRSGPTIPGWSGLSCRSPCSPPCGKAPTESLRAGRSRLSRGAGRARRRDRASLRTPRRCP